MRLVLVDAYDSFTHNLVHALHGAGATVEVVRCDRVGPDDLFDREPDAVVLGPGPGEPQDAGCFVPAARALLGRIPLLGVCLGHQALAVALGGRLARAAPVHGRATAVHHDGTGLFAGLPPAVALTRYHSLTVDPAALPAELRVVARADDGTIQALAHRRVAAFGVQFHPEAVLSGAAGQRLLDTFVAIAAPQLGAATR